MRGCRQRVSTADGTWLLCAAELSRRGPSLNESARGNDQAAIYFPISVTSMYARDPVNRPLPQASGVKALIGFRELSSTRGVIRLHLSVSQSRMIWSEYEPARS